MTFRSILLGWLQPRAETPAPPEEEHSQGVVDELRRHSALLSLINEINHILVSEPFSDQVMDTLCDVLRERFSLTLVSVYLLQPKLGLQLLAHSGEGIPEGHSHLALDSFELMENDGLIATTVKTNTPTYAPDVSKVPGYLQGHPEVRSEYVVPLLAGDEVLGALNFESNQLDGFDEAQRELLDRVAQQGSLAIQRTQILRRMQDNELRYQLATAAGQVGTWDWNVETREVFIDQVILHALGLKPSEMDGQLESCLRLFPQPDRRRIVEAVTACLRGESPIYEIEHRAMHTSGGTRWILARAEPRHNAEGKITRLLGTATDITEKKEYELAILEAKETAEAASEAKSEFLARMSHELRTPLHGVIGSASLLTSMNLDPEPTQLVDTIQLSARVLLSTINDILEISKIEAGHVELEREAFSIIDCLEDTFRVVESGARDKGLTLEHQIDPSAPVQVVGDFIRLRQVLINLTHNAIKFTDRGGVTVRARKLDGEHPNVHLEFAVQDTGQGISEGEQTRLFEPFTQADTSSTRRHDGTGLGLAICAHLVRLMGGRIWIESQVGEGSTLYFTLEVETHDAARVTEIRQQAPPEDQQTSPLAFFNGQLRVLLAEDNPVNQKVTEMQLRSLGCSVDVAANGVATLEAFSVNTYDLVLMDCQMPEVNGFDATAQIRSQEEERRHRTPIIGLTAYATAADRQRCLAAGMDDHLAKPVTVQEISRLLRRWIRTDSDTSPQVESRPAKNASRGPQRTFDGQLLDETRLNHLRDLSVACGEDILGKAVELFARDAPGYLKALRRQADAADFETLSKTAHTLKGSAETLGARRLSTLCQELEEIARDADQLAAQSRLSAAQHIFEQTLAELQTA